MHTYYHVSSLLKGCTPVLRRFKKPLQAQVDFCQRIDCSTLQSFAHGIEMIEREYGDIGKLTGRDVYKWMSESLFEHVRRTSFSDRPSRMNGIFLCASLDDATEFNKKYRNGSAKIYSCEIDDGAVVSFNMQIFTKVDETIRHSRGIVDELSFAKLTSLAEDYWSDNCFHGKTQELLCEQNELKLLLVCRA